MPESGSVRRVPSIAAPLSTDGRVSTVTRGQFPWTVVGALLIAFTLAFYSWKWLIDADQTSTALIVIPLILMFTAPVMVREARSEPGFDIAGLMLVGLGMRFAFAYYRMTHASDAVIYYKYGVKLAASYRVLNFGADPGAQVPGTGGMRIVAGVVQIFVNDSYFASYLVMGWLGFWGCWFLYKA